MSDPLVVVGASVGGITVTSSLRDGGYSGDIVLLDAQCVDPYQRPPLSKEVVAGADLSVCRLSDAATLAVAGIDWRPGMVACGLDLDRGAVITDGGHIPFSALVVATGASPVIPFPADSPRVHTLRTAADAARLCPNLRTGARVVIIGGGVLGSEMASAARRRGCLVTLVSDRALTLGPLGERLSRQLVELHRERGIDVELGRSVREVVDSGGQAEVRAAGQTWTADVVVVAAGVRAGADWLGDAVMRDHRGVVCDGRGRAARQIWAIGDVASWAGAPVGFPGTQTAAMEQARLVAADILGAELPRRPPPYFWADVHGIRIQVAGQLPKEAQIDVVDGVEAGTFSGVVEVDGVVVGAVGWGDARGFRAARARVGQPVLQVVAGRR